MSRAPQSSYGNILTVNLATGLSVTGKVPSSYITQYIGGRGLGARLLWDLIPAAGVDPYSPQNPLLLIPGPFSGLPIPSSTRTSVVTKSPHVVAAREGSFKSTISYSNIGGYIGPAIRKAGYEGIAITGKAEKLVYLVIDDKEIRIEDAAFIAGRSTDETLQLIEQRLGKGFNICYIGPAGESGSPIATIMTSGSSAAGRGGAGAIMGSKNLKAVAIRGTGKPAIANTQKYYSLIGTLASEDINSMEEETVNPCKLCNLECRKGGYSKDSTVNSKSSGGHSISKMLGRIMDIKDQLILGEMVKMADKWGVDIISSAVILSAFFGNKLPLSGSEKILKEYLKICMNGEPCHTDSNIITKVPGIKGHEFALFRPLSELNKWALSHATSNRGSCHINGSSPSRQDENALTDSIGACTYAKGFFGSEINYADYIEAITGIRFTDEELINVGNRVFTLEKMFNVREGFSREDDTIPSSFYAKKESGVTGLVTPDLKDVDRILETYYLERGWNVKTSVPPSSVLNKLDLGFTIP